MCVSAFTFPNLMLHDLQSMQKVIWKISKHCLIYYLRSALSERYVFRLVDFLIFLVDSLQIFV